MDCKYFVTVKPDELKDGTLSLERHHRWLCQMNIKRFRGGYFTENRPNYWHKTAGPFRFEKREDAVAFKVMFGGSGNVK